MPTVFKSLLLLLLIVIAGGLWYHKPTERSMAEVAEELLPYTENHQSEERPVQPIEISESEILEWLQSELTVQSVIEKLGPPLNGVPEAYRGWGNLMYPLGENRYLFFHFKGPYVTSARYDKQSMTGVPVKTHKIRVLFHFPDTFHIMLDDRNFLTVASLLESLQDLPEGSIVEYQATCDIFDNQPLSTIKEYEQVKQRCKDLGLYWVYYPAG